MFRDYLEGRRLDEHLDAATRNFDGKFLVAMETIPAIGEVTDLLLSEKPKRKIDLQYLAEFLPRAFAALELEYDPEHLFETGDVSPSFQRIQDSNEAMFKFLLNRGRPIQSNIGRRAWFLAWTLQAHGLTDDRPILEFGASGMAIGKQLTEVIAGKREHQQVQMMERRRIGAANRLVVNPALTRLMHEVVSGPFAGSPRYSGLDLFSPHDPAVQAWTRACSQYLTDWTNPGKRAEYDYLQRLDHPNVQWLFEDFSNFTLEHYQTAFPCEDRPRAIYIPFSIYELESDKARRRTLNQAVEIVTHEDDATDPRRPGGVVAVLDDIRSIDCDNNVKIVNRRRDYSTCGGWVYSSKVPDAGFQKYFSFQNGRLDAAIPEAGLSILGLAAVRDRRASS